MLHNLLTVIKLESSLVQNLPLINGLFLFLLKEVVLVKEHRVNEELVFRYLR